MGMKKLLDRFLYKFEGFIDKNDDKEINSIYRINISDRFGEEWVPFTQDLLRMITIQTMFQLMLFLRDSEENPFFSQTYFELVFYIIIGLMAYWFLIRRWLYIQ
jgi:hypothetical protein